MTVKINLLPWREELKEFKKKQFIALMGLALVIASIIVFIFSTWGALRISQQRSLNQYLESEIRVLDDRISQINALQKEREKLLSRMDVIQRLQSNRSSIVKLFDNLIRVVPNGLYLNSVTRTGAQLLVEGKAESNTQVSKFMRNIEKSQWLKKPLLSTIEAMDEKDKQEIIGFNLKAIEVEPNL